MRDFPRPGHLVATAWALVIAGTLLVLVLAFGVAWKAHSLVRYLRGRPHTTDEERAAAMDAWARRQFAPATAALQKMEDYYDPVTSDV